MTAAPAPSPAEIARAGQCIGCGLSAARGPASARMGFDRYGQLKPQGGRDFLDSRSTLFARVCPFSPALGMRMMWRASSSPMRPQRTPGSAGSAPCSQDTPGSP